MPTVQIQTISDGETHSYSQTTQLDDRDFVFTFTWIERANAWALSMALPDEDPIFTGKFITLGVDMLRAVVHDSKPAGRLFAAAYDGSEGWYSVGLEDLGTRVGLFYDDESEE